MGASVRPEHIASNPAAGGIIGAHVQPANSTENHGIAAKPRATIPQPLQAAQIPDALLTIETAVAIAGLSSSTIYRKAASDPTFPKLVRIGTRCTRIRAGDLTAWLAAQAGAAE